MTRVVIGHLTEAKTLELEALLSGDRGGHAVVELPARFRDANGERAAVVVFEREPRKSLAFSSPETISETIAEFAQRPAPPETTEDRAGLSVDHERPPKVLSGGFGSVRRL